MAKAVTQEESPLLKAYRFCLRNWNAILAGTSLCGVVFVSLVPPLQQYGPVFVFACANAIVWTLIEIKVGLRPTDTVRQFDNMRVARPAILRDIYEQLSKTEPGGTLTAVFVGGRLRSMADIVREMYDDLVMGRVVGHLEVHLYCLDPEYIAARLLPGGMDSAAQQSRNASWGEMVKNASRELAGLEISRSQASSMSVRICHYQADPHWYAYLIGHNVLYWGPYVYSEDSSDLIGPGNACFRLSRSDAMYGPVFSWIASWARLYSLAGSSAAQERVDGGD